MNTFFSNEFELMQKGKEYEEIAKQKENQRIFDKNRRKEIDIEKESKQNRFKK